MTRALLCLLALLASGGPGTLYAQQVPNPMSRDGANAQNPAAMTHLLAGGAITPTLAVNGASLTAPTVLPFAVKGDGYTGIARFTYGAAGAPQPVDPAFGYTGFASTVYGNPGTGTADPFTSAVYGSSHLSAGSRGIALGVIGHAYTEGTWTNGGAFEPGAVGVWGQAESTRGGNVFGVAAACKSTVTNGGAMTCLEIDTSATANVVGKFGLAINSTAQDTGAVTGVKTVAGGASAANGAAIFVQGLGGTFPYILLTVQETGGMPPIQSNGALWRAGGFTAARGLDWSDMTFSGNAIDVGAGKVKAGGIVATAMPTSCSGQPSGTLWNSAGTVHVCP
jgi:hypothetical protein